MMQDFSPPRQKTQPAKKVPRGNFSHKFYIESFGVKIGFSTNSAEALEAVREAVKSYLPGCFEDIEEIETEHNFTFVWNKSKRDTLYKNGEMIFRVETRKFSVNTVASQIRLTVAEFAVGRVFIHSGVVSWKGKAIIIPAKSMGGKTTLTAALVKRGALYYSDEYAILDEEGFVHPFPKTLSIRGILDNHQQVEHTVEEIGGKSALEKTRIGMFLISRYQSNVQWNPQILSRANGIFEILNHTVPIRTNPDYTFRVLTQAVSQAVIVKADRGDVLKSVNLILDFFEKHCL
jgi:hypothetical protein